MTHRQELDGYSAVSAALENIHSFDFPWQNTCKLWYGANLATFCKKKARDLGKVNIPLVRSPQAIGSGIVPCKKAYVTLIGQPVDCNLFIQFSSKVTRLQSGRIARSHRPSKLKSKFRSNLKNPTLKPSRNLKQKPKSRVQHTTAHGDHFSD